MKLHNSSWLLILLQIADVAVTLWLLQFPSIMLELNPFVIHYGFGLMILAKTIWCVLAVAGLEYFYDFPITRIVRHLIVVMYLLALIFGLSSFLLTVSVMTV